MNKIDGKELKSAVKLINDSGLLEELDKKNLRVVGIKMEVLAEEMGDVVDALADKGKDGELPESVITCYNNIFGTAEPEDAPEEEKVEPEKKEKPAPKKNAKKEEPAEKKVSPASKKPRSCYGHIASAKSGKLDELLKEGATYAELMETCDVKLHRVKGHVTVLKNKGLTVLLKEDKDAPENTHVQIKEASI